MSNAAMPLSAVKAEGRKLLFMGPPGTGKTTAAALYKPTAKKLFLDLDMKLALQENIPAQVRANIDIWTPGVPLAGSRIQVTKPGEGIPKDPKGYQLTVDFINSQLDLGDKYPYEVTVLDGFSTLADHLDRLVKSHNKVTTFQLQHWGLFGTNLKDCLDGFLALPGDKIVIVHSKLIQDETTNVVFAKPLVAGFMSDALPKDFSEVYYFLGEGTIQVPTKDGKGTTSEKKFMVRTRASTKYPSRTTKAFQAEESVETVLAELNK